MFCFWISGLADRLGFFLVVPHLLDQKLVNIAAITSGIDVGGRRVGRFIGRAGKDGTISRKGRVGPVSDGGIIGRDYKESVISPVIPL